MAGTASAPSFRSSSQLSQLTEPRYELPKHPELPEDVINRFPSLAEYQAGIKTWWNRTRASLYESYESNSLTTDAKVSEISDRVSSLKLTLSEDALSAVYSQINQVVDDLSALTTTVDGLSASFGLRVNTYAQPTEPSSPSLQAGDLWFDTDDSNKIYRFEGGAWTALSDIRIGGAVAAITNIQTTYATRAYAEAMRNEAIVSAASYTDAITGAITASIATITTDYATKAYADGSAYARKAEAITASSTYVDGRILTRNKVFRQPGAPVATAVGDIWIKTGAPGGVEFYTWDGSAWAIARDVEIASMDARIDVVEYTTTNTSDPSALAYRMVTLESSVSTPVTGILARIQTVETTYATRTYAEAQKTDAISSARSYTDTGLSTKNKIWRQGSAPLSGLTIGDLWIDTSDVNRQYSWDGTSWVISGDTRVGTLTTSVADITTNYATKVYADGTATARKTEAITSANSYTDTGLTNKNKVFAAGSAPTATAIGDVWFDTSNNNLCYRWNGSAWVLVADARIGTLTTSVASIQSDYATQTYADGRAVARKTEAITAAGSYTDTGLLTRNKIFAQGSAPTAVSNGDLWFDTSDTNKAYRWNGSAWVLVVDTRIDATASTVSSLTSTVNNKVSTFASGSAPTATAVGDLWIDTGHNNKQFRWSGVSWIAVDDKNKNSTFVQGSAPAATAVGDIWFDSSDVNRQYRWNGSAWVQVADTRIAASATAISSLDAQINTAGTGILARVNTISAAYVDSSGATALANSAITASIASGSAGTIGAAITSEATARATADGFLSGKYTLKAIAGNIITGINITSQSGGGTDLSEIVFQAGVVKFVTGGGNKGPVTEGSAAADINANTTTVSGGKITANSIDVSKLTVSDLSQIAGRFIVGTSGTVDRAELQSGNFKIGNFHVISTAGITTASVLTAGNGVYLRGSFSAVPAIATWESGGTTNVTISSNGTGSFSSTVDAYDFVADHNVDAGNAVRSDRYASLTGTTRIQAGVLTILGGTIEVENTANFTVSSTLYAAGDVDITGNTVARAGLFALGAAEFSDTVRITKGSNSGPSSGFLTPFLSSVVHKANSTSKYGLFVGTNWAAAENVIFQAASVDASTGTVTNAFRVLGDRKIEVGGRITWPNGAYIQENGGELWVSDSFGYRRL